MFSVGLTGNVASGKSTVARHFAAWGATVIDADRLVRDVQQPGSPVLAAIAERFGADVVGPEGLERGRLRRLVMGDDAARQALNAIVHPAVQRRRADLVAAARARGDRIVVHDIPLLFEALDPNDFDIVVLVDAPPEVRRARLIAERDLEPGEADDLLAAQSPTAPKRARSDIVIENTGSLASLEAAARDAWQTILERAERDAKSTGSG
ncbi:MAG: dephospho-CoA kinase [Gemmatimonadales bacterium]|jgi:dephospho-CoA kinase